MSRLWMLTLLLLVLTAAGCSNRATPSPTWTALRDADTYELLSLDPHQELEPLPEDVEFHGYRVLGRMKVTDPATRKKLNDALHKGVREHDGGAAGCFTPRHGIRVSRDGQVHDLVICFECTSVAVYKDDHEVEGFTVSGSPQPTFDNVLMTAGVPLTDR